LALDHLVERALGLVAPARVALAARAEQLVAADAPGHAVDDLFHHRHELETVRPDVELDPGPRVLEPCDRDRPAVAGDLRPAHVADLGTPTAGRPQHPRHWAGVALRRVIPDQLDLGVGEHAAGELDLLLDLVGVDEDVLLEPVRAAAQAPRHRRGAVA